MRGRMGISAVVGVMLVCAANARALDITNVTMQDAGRLLPRERKVYHGRDSFVYMIKPGAGAGVLHIQGSIRDAIAGDTVTLIDDLPSQGSAEPPRMVRIDARGNFNFDVEISGERRLILGTVFDDQAAIIQLQPLPPRPTAYLEGVEYTREGWTPTSTPLTPLGGGAGTLTINLPVVGLAIRGERTTEMPVALTSDAGHVRTLRFPYSQEKSPQPLLLPLEPGVNRIALSNPADGTTETFAVEFRPPAVFTMTPPGLAAGRVFASPGEKFSVTGTIPGMRGGPVRCTLGKVQTIFQASSNQFSGQISPFAEQELVAFVKSPQSSGPNTPGDDGWLALARLPLQAVHSIESLKLRPMSRMDGAQKACGESVSLLAGTPPAVNSPHLDLSAALHPNFPKLGMDDCVFNISVQSADKEFASTGRFTFHAGKIVGRLAGEAALPLKPVLVFPGSNRLHWTLESAGSRVVLDRGEATVNCGPSADQQLWACMVWKSTLNDLDLYAQLDEGVSRWVYHVLYGKPSQPHLLVADIGGPGAEVFVVPQTATMPKFLQFSVRLDSNQHGKNHLKRPWEVCDVWLYIYRDRKELKTIKVKMDKEASDDMSSRVLLGEPLRVD